MRIKSCTCKGPIKNLVKEMRIKFNGQYKPTKSRKEFESHLLFMCQYCNKVLKGINL